MDLQADRLADVSELFGTDELFEEDEDEDVNERFVNINCF